MQSEQTVSAGAQQAARVLAHVLQHPGEDLGTLFRLPDLTSIQPRVTPETFTIVSNHYAKAPTHIAQAFTIAISWTERWPPRLPFCLM
jgi:hypothetical protein